MATTYYTDTTAADLTISGGAFTHKLWNSQPPGSGSDGPTTAASGSGTSIAYYLAPAGDPSTSGASGSYTVSINITAIDAGVTVQPFVGRVNSAGAVQAVVSAGTAVSTIGIHTWNVIPSLGTWASGDRLALRFVVTNTNAHGGAKGATWETGSANDSIVAPWSGSITNNDSGSGTIALGGSASDSHSVSDTAAGTISFAGTAVESFGISDAGSGSVQLAGSAVESHGAGFVDAGSGAITLSGSSAESFTITDANSGTLSFLGSSSESNSLTVNASGSLSLSGSGIESASQSATAAGTVVFSGSATESFVGAFNDTGTGTISLSGSGADAFQPPQGADPIIIQKTGTSSTAVMQKAAAGYTYIIQKTGTSATPVAQKTATGWTTVSGG